MTTDTQPLAPTDAEILAVIREVSQGSAMRREGGLSLRIARAVLAKWGSPAGAGAPVAPDFYTACAWYEGGGEAGWIPLPGYSNETERGVKHLVLEAARKEGYKGTVAGRLFELGWEIRPVYLAPQPTQPQAGAAPMSHEAAKALVRKYGNDPLHLVLQVERHHGITGGQHGAD